MTRPARTPMPADFWRLWTSSTVSNIGDGMRLTVLPLLMASLSDEPLTVAGQLAVSYLPWLLFSLPAGPVADSVRRRTLMVRVQIFRGALVAGLAIAVATGGVTVALLYVVTFILGIAEVFYDTTAQTAIPAVVKKSQLERANSLMYIGEDTANEFAGPPLGSLLLTLARPVPFIVDAVTYAISAFTLSRITVDFDPDEQQPSNGRFSDQIRDGIRFVMASPFLRSWTAMIAVLNLARAMTLAVFVLYVVDVLDASPLTFGLLSAVVAVGAVIGSWATVRIVARAGRPITLAAGLLLHGASNMLLASVATVPTTAVATLVFGLSVSIINVIFVSIRQAMVPAEILGRVGSVQRFASWGSLSIGAALGGMIASTGGIRLPYAVAGGLVYIAAALLWRQLMMLPTEADSLDYPPT